MSEQEVVIVEEIYSVPTTITLDRRRAAQISHMAQGQRKTVAAWLEDIVSKEWQRVHHGMTVPSIKLFTQEDVDGRISAGIHFEPLKEQSAILASADTATELAQMLGRAAEGRGATTQAIGCDKGQRVTIFRKGNGIVVQIDDFDTDGKIYRHIVGMTPTLASEYATAIDSHAARINTLRRTNVTEEVLQ